MQDQVASQMMGSLGAAVPAPGSLMGADEGPSALVPIVLLSIALAGAAFVWALMRLLFG